MPEATFFYTYVLLCADGQWYIGSTDDLMRRVREHREARCPDTAKRLPVELVYYEACRESPFAFRSKPDKMLIRDWVRLR